MKICVRFENNEDGLIVDYIGIASALKAVRKQYTESDQKKFRNVDVSKTSYLILLLFPLGYRRQKAGWRYPAAVHMAVFAVTAAADNTALIISLHIDPKVHYKLSIIPSRLILNPWVIDHPYDDYQSTQYLERFWNFVKEKCRKYSSDSWFAQLGGWYKGRG